MIRSALRMWLRWWMWLLLKSYDLTTLAYYVLSVREAKRIRQKLDSAVEADAPGSDSVVEVDAPASAFDMHNWPRRLLHVPTMTSVEWQPGNIYGGIENPAYNILTYTWGRWRTMAMDEQVEPLKVNGVPWSIPSVVPEHFTASQFENVIKACTTEARRPSGWLINRSRPVDFIWLDVACIHQQVQAETLQEVGRQAKIFFEAEETYVWLTRFDFIRLKEITDQLERCVTDLLYVYDDVHQLEKRVQSTFDCLSALLSDPWFSSLWTLQEAYLRPDAVLLSKEGLPIPHNAEKDRTIGRIFQRASTVHHVCLTRLHLEGEHFTKLRQLCLNTIELIEKAGLAALNTQNPLAVYGVSRFRMTSRSHDRVYGIQQIFELRLGLSKKTSDGENPHTPEKHDYTLEELEDQFGTSLLQKYPILSQLHVIMVPAKLGSAWRVGPKSEVPQLRLFGNGNWKWVSSERPLAQLSSQRVGPTLWGYFEGKACDFASLRTAWASVDAQPRYNSLINNITSVSIFLDNTYTLRDSPEYQEKRYEAIPRDRRQHAVARWLCNHFADDKLCVLLLGSLTGPGRVTLDERDPLDLKYYVGMIILRQEKDQMVYWSRLGFCAWEVEHLTYDGQDAPEKAFLEGEDDQWLPENGIFG